MDLLQKIGSQVEEHFKGSKRVLSFAEYLELARNNPRAQTRGAAQYLLDMFEHFGWDEVPAPGGETRRARLFDAPWDGGRASLVGQEEVQAAIYRNLRNFVRQGRVDRFILLTGPNGSAKSTITEMLSRAMEQYSRLDEGALYRFNWIFPTEKLSRSGIGFGGSSGGETARDDRVTFAHLEEHEVDARVPCEMGDHPLLLVPRDARQALLKELSEDGVMTSDYLLRGNLCPKCKLIYEALLASYEGDYLRLLRHVQVNRFFASRRYRQATSRVEPQMAVDAVTRQITADRSLGALPTALQNINLYELDGHLVKANRGVVDFSDLLKRPIEAFKYLLIAVEEGRVSLDQANIFFDLLFVGSSNETHLNALMESHEWTSFKARIELVRVPYLRDYRREKQIYDAQVGQGQVVKHIAPHATAVAALWAVLTRLFKPNEEKYDAKVKPLIKKLTPLEKAELYARGELPGWARGDDAKRLRGAVKEIWRETQAEVVYEGRIGASPREMKTLILDAAQDPLHDCLSPNAVFTRLQELVKETSVYAYLRMQSKDGYFENERFIDLARGWYLDQADREVSDASGLIEEESHHELFSRYLSNVMHQTRGEKVQNEVTGAYEEPDAQLMAQVEKDLETTGNVEDFRKGLISRIGAWSVDHAGEKPNYRDIFPQQLEQLRSAYFNRRKERLQALLERTLRVLGDDESGMSDEEIAEAKEVVARLEERHGYCEHCAREALALLLGARYADS